MRVEKVRILLGVVIALAARGSSLCAATLHTAAFDADLDGWSGPLSPSPDRVASGGPGGEGDAYLHAPNSENGNLAVHNTGAAWTGSFSEIGALSINADLMSPTDSEPLEMRIVLFAPLDARWTSTAGQAVPNDGVWRNYTFSIAEEALMLVRGAPTTTYAGLMSNVVRVMFRHDAVGGSGGTPVQGTLNLDNIELAAAPPVEIPGDFTGDGVVDGADLDDPVEGWRARFGADLDGNDFLVWQRQLGAPLAAAHRVGAGATAAVPEPQALVMILAAAALGSWRQRILSRTP